MKYRRNGDQILIRIDKGEEILDTILKICTVEKIYGAVFSGIGACSKAVVSSYIPEEIDFMNHEANMACWS